MDMKEKKVSFWFAGFFCLAVLIWLLPGCARPEEVSLAPLSDTEDGNPENEYLILNAGEVNAVGSVFPVSFEGIVAAEDLTRFIAGVDYADGTHNNEAQETGLILSPCFTMTAGGAAVPCYAARTALGAHSFAMLDVGEDAFPLELSVSVQGRFQNVAVLPERRGVEAQAAEASFRASVDGFGDYTFVLDDDRTRALTVLIRRNEPYEPPAGYDVVRIAPGRHEEKIGFTGEKQVLFFEAGVHELKYNITFLNNTEVHLERGALIYAVMPDRGEPLFQDPDWAGQLCWYALFQGKDVSNVRISGHGMVDMSRLDWHARLFVWFDASDNIVIDGLSCNNCPEWTVHISQCEDVTVSDVMLIGYRQNSDGICVEDSRNVLVRDCFARSGDDLFEVKSRYGSCPIPIENIVFENCTAWPDKARGIGIICETKRDMKDITFKDCSVGFASAAWMEDLGALVVYAENDAHIESVTFENIEIHQASKYPINVTLGSESRARIDGLVFRRIDIGNADRIRICNRSTAGGSVGGIAFEACSRRGRIASDEKALQLSVQNVDGKVISVTAGEP